MVMLIVDDSDSAVHDDDDDDDLKIIYLVGFVKKKREIYVLYTVGYLILIIKGE